MKIQESIRYSGTKVVVLKGEWSIFFFFGKLPKEEAIIEVVIVIGVACGGV